MMTIEQYFGPWINHPDATPERKENARVLLSKVNALLADAVADGVVLRDNPCTECGVSGEKYGGFRPQDCSQGAPGSSHKNGEGVDRYDHLDALDQWLNKFEDGHGGNSMLEKHELYREHPDDTYMGSNGKPAPWCHLTIRSPKSGRRTFKP